MPEFKDGVTAKVHKMYYDANAYERSRRHSAVCFSRPHMQPWPSAHSTDIAEKQDLSSLPKYCQNEDFVMYVFTVQLRRNLF